MSNPIPATVRPLRAEDQDAWRKLWAAYLAFYGSRVSDDIYTGTFDRLLGDDARDHSCLIAEVDGVPVGLAHYLFHRHAWKHGDVCYLQDLYAAPDVRGRGVGRALIEAVYAAADAQGAEDTYWMTQKDNATARQLYDRIGQKTPFIKYARRAA